MSLLVVDSITTNWAVFDPVSLQVKKMGSGQVRVRASAVSKVGLIVWSLPSGRGLARANEAKLGLGTKEKSLVRSLQRFGPLWLISDAAFFASLPIEVTAAGVDELHGGLTHVSLLEAASRALGKPTTQLNLITLYLDQDSSATAIRGGVPVEMTTKIGPQPDLVGWSGMKQPLAPTLSHPKLRLNPKFQLGLRIYFHDLTLLVGAYAGLLGRLDAVVLAGTLGEEDIVREELLKRLPFLLSVNLLVGQARPLQMAAEILHHL